MAGPLKEYVTEVNGVQTTLLLTEDDAKARGLQAASPTPAKKAAPTPSNKARRAPNKKV